MDRAEYAAWRRENHPEGLTCEFDDNALYAKGLCWKHYRRLHDQGFVIGPPRPRGRLRGTRKTRTCKRCGKDFKRKHPKRDRQRTLCRTCIWFRNCTICGQEFDATDTGRKHCDECRFDDFYDYWKWWAEQNREDLNRKARARNSRRRAAEHGADFTHEDIFERDNWQCMIPDCLYPGEPVDPNSTAPDPKSPSLDHIVPLSQDGPHVPANVRCSHLRCNTVRHVGNHEDPVQLAFI